MQYTYKTHAIVPDGREKENYFNKKLQYFQRKIKGAIVGY